MTPEYGEIYTIYEIEHDKSGAYLRFDEIRNRRRLYPQYGLREVAFHASRFRPVVQRQTDISVFERILESCKPKQTAKRKTCA